MIGAIADNLRRIAVLGKEYDAEPDRRVTARARDFGYRVITFDGTVSIADVATPLS